MSLASSGGCEWSCHFSLLGRRSAALGDLYLRPTVTDRGFDISSKGNDDLTELTTVLQIAVHFHHIVELECTIDQRLERATREALGDVLRARDKYRADAMLYVATTGYTNQAKQQAKASGIRKTLRRKGECLIEFLASGVVVFDLNKFMVVVFCSLVVNPATAGLKEGKKTPREEHSYPGFRSF